MFGINKKIAGLQQAIEDVKTQSERSSDALTEAFSARLAQLSKQIADMQSVAAQARTDFRQEVLKNQAESLDRITNAFASMTAAEVQKSERLHGQLLKETADVQARMLACQEKGWQDSCETMVKSFEETSGRFAERLTAVQDRRLSDFAQAQETALIKVEEARELRQRQREDVAIQKIKGDGLKAAYALNACMVSVSQIVDYNDVNVLRQEYDNLLNNLNLENIIKDDSLLDALKKILDTCHFYILHAKDKEMLKKKQALRLKGALGNALGSGNVIALFGNPNPYVLAAGVLAMVGIAAVRYKSERDKAKLENELEEWELEKSALEQLHNLRRTLFETAWRLAERYQYPDEWRLTERQIKIYNDIIAITDPLSRFESLRLLDDQFEAYPLFWYYKGRAALEVAMAYRTEEMLAKGKDGKVCEQKLLNYGGDDSLYRLFRNEAKTALDEFVKRQEECQIFRTDVLTASAYLDRASLILSDDKNLDNPESVRQIRKDVDNAKKLGGTDLEIVQACAMYYLKLHENNSEDKGAFKNAEYCLRMLLNEDFNAELNGRWLSQLYLFNNDDARYEFLKASIKARHPFIYSVMIPKDAESFKRDFDEYFAGTDFLRTVYNYCYGRLRCIYMDFFAAKAAMCRECSWDPIARLVQSTGAENATAHEKCDWTPANFPELEDEGDEAKAKKAESESWILNRRKKTWFVDGIQFNDKINARIIIGQGVSSLRLERDLANLESRFISNVCKYVVNSKERQFKHWFGMVKTLSEYEDQEVDTQDEMVEISFREFATTLAKELAEKIREELKKHRDKAQSGNDEKDQEDRRIEALDLMAELANFLEHESERFRLQIKEYEFCNGKFRYPPFSDFADYKIQSGDAEVKYSVKMEFVNKVDRKISVSIWETSKDGKLESVQDCFLSEQKKPDVDKNEIESFFVSKDGVVKFNANKGIVDGKQVCLKPRPENYEQVSGFIYNPEGQKLCLEGELNMVPPDKLDFCRAEEDWQSFVKEKIKERQSFRIIDVSSGRQTEIVNAIEEEIEHAKLKCRVRTNNRGAWVAFPGIGWVYGGMILAHNACTSNPDYEIIRDMFGGNVYVKGK